MKLTLKIENFYDGDPDPIVRTRTVECPEPPTDADGYAAWSEEFIYPETGVGRASGESSYFVKCIDSDFQWMIDREWEFGL